jgi:uncharacterized repeat protein (TIGR02059 family)
VEAVIDESIPLYQNASVDGTTLTLTYDEALKTDGLPGAAAFTVKVNDQSATVSSVAIDSSDSKKLDITLENAVKFGQKVTFSYTDPTANDDTNAIQDAAGNDAASLSDYGASNLTEANKTSGDIATKVSGKWAVFEVGGGNYSINNVVNNDAPANLGKGVKMPLGSFSFDITGGGDLGFTADLSMTVDASLKQATYYKYNYETKKYVNIAKGVEIKDGKAIIRFSLKDGDAYDADRTANGTIQDPGGSADNALLPVVFEGDTAVSTVGLINTDKVTGTLSYAITGGADKELFEIDATTGALTFKTAPDYEKPTDTGDTAGNNTYAVTVKITSASGGSETQPLIVTVMNKPEAGDKDVGSNVTATEQTVTFEPTPTGGGGGGTPPPTDAPTETPTPAPTETPTPAPTETPTPAPTETPTPAPTETPTPAPTETPTPAPTETPTSTTVDGATVTTGTTTINGETVETLTVSPVPTAREDTGGDAGRADVSLFYGDAGKSVPATTASLPAGVGLTSTGARVPANDTEALASLMALVEKTAGNSESNRPDMVSGGNAFLTRLAQQADKGPLIINSVTLTVAPGQTTAPGQPITISGTAERVGQGSGNGGAPVEALVIDTRALPPGTVLELKNIEFAVIIGDNVIVRGGEGQNIVFAGTGSHNIVLGDDDDELSGGDGDDVVGSRGGNDRLNGDGDNDWLVGGEGDDVLNGGTGNDLLHGGISDAGMYRFAVDSADQLHLAFQARHPDLAPAAELGFHGPWKTATGETTLTDERLAFTGADMGVLEDVALLYQALTKALPTVANLNTWAASGLSSTQLAELAYQFYTAQQPPGAQALEVQVANLITQVWGEAADPALVQIGVDYLNQGGSWAEGLLYLARHEKNSAAIRTEEGQTRLAKDWVLKETGWSGEGGNDQLFGGEGNDVLVAGSGNNVLDGGEGTDLAVFFGHVDDWQVVFGAQGQIVVSNRHTGAQNEVRDIELFQFGGTVLGQLKPEYPEIVTGTAYAITDFLLPATAGQIALIGVASYADAAVLG